jgi:hypothetical protein
VPVHLLAGNRGQRIDARRGGVGGGRVLLELIELIKEPLRGVEPVRQVSPSGLEDQGVEGICDAVEHCVRVQATVRGEPLDQGAALRGRWLAGEDQIGDRTEPEDVQVNGVGVGNAELGRKVHLGGVTQVLAGK